jgi:hypothetical protein
MGNFNFNETIESSYALGAAFFFVASIGFLLLSTFFLAIIEGSILEEFQFSREIKTDTDDYWLHLVVYRILKSEWSRFQPQKSKLPKPVVNFLDYVFSLRSKQPNGPVVS